MKRSVAFQHPTNNQTVFNKPQLATCSHWSHVLQDEQAGVVHPIPKHCHWARTPKHKPAALRTFCQSSLGAATWFGTPSMALRSRGTARPRLSSRLTRAGTQRSVEPCLCSLKAHSPCLMSEQERLGWKLHHNRQRHFVVVKINPNPGGFSDAACRCVPCQRLHAASHNVTTCHDVLATIPPLSSLAARQALLHPPSALLGCKMPAEMLDSWRKRSATLGSTDAISQSSADLFRVRRKTSQQPTYQSETEQYWMSEDGPDHGIRETQRHRKNLETGDTHSESPGTGDFEAIGKLRQ
mmetsp:Transcript_32161/g.67962  ORF Transcript_32161/g.67962 Transcript_32161/m.67962 type:complete len:296 (-) Transcript_32161:109-996(-)